MSEKVLYLEDEIPWHSKMSALLKDTDLTLETASSVSEALQKISMTTYCLAIIDLSMIEHDSENREGYEVIKKLAELDEGTQIFIFSGYGEPTEVSAAYDDYPINRYISKTENPKKIRDDIVAFAELGASNIRKPKPVGPVSGFFYEKAISMMEEFELKKGKRQATANELQKFFESLIGQFTPLIPEIKSSEFFTDSKVSYGIRARMWSKRLGSPLMVWIGSHDGLVKINDDIKHVNSSTNFLSSRILHRLFSTYDLPQHFGGLVFALKDKDLGPFESRK